MMLGQKLNVHRIFKRPAKALIRLRVCAGWSEPLLVSHTSLVEISCCGSIIIFFFEIMTCNPSINITDYPCITVANLIGDFIGLKGLMPLVHRNAMFVSNRLIIHKKPWLKSFHEGDTMSGPSQVLIVALFVSPIAILIVPLW